MDYILNSVQFVQEKTIHIEVQILYWIESQQSI